jgi:hypothetical protein
LRTTHLLIFLGQLVPALSHLQVHSVRLHLLAFVQGVLNVLPDNGPSLLGVQEHGSERPLRGVRITLLLLCPFALLLAALGDTASDSSDSTSSRLGSFNRRLGLGCEVGRQLKAINSIGTTSEDGGCVLDIGAEQLSEAVLHVSEAGLEGCKGHDDLWAMVNMSSQFVTARLRWLPVRDIAGCAFGRRDGGKERRIRSAHV